MIMKTNLTQEKFEEKYIEYCIILSEARDSGDYKKNNYYAKKHNDLLRIAKDCEFIKPTMKKLLNCSNPEVSSSAAADSIRLGIWISESEKILKYVSRKYKKTLLGVDTEIALKRWKKEHTLD